MHMAPGWKFYGIKITWIVAVYEEVMALNEL
jgi:hypothetical protein